MKSFIIGALSLELLGVVIVVSGICSLGLGIDRAARHEIEVHESLMPSIVSTAAVNWLPGAPPLPSANNASVRPVVRGAHIRDEDTVFNWGAISAGKNYQHTFVLHNIGDEVLHILKTKPN
ncbi:MAG: hypothetical protein WCR59_03060 [Planctomycetota bacterium]|jgi:hypothetical protein